MPVPSHVRFKVFPCSIACKGNGIQKYAKQVTVCNPDAQLYIKRNPLQHLAPAFIESKYFLCSLI
jgi:hypothetical protein